MAAEAFVHSLTKIDAQLGLVEHKLGGEYSSTADPRLNPARLLRRIRQLEEELPNLMAAAEANATSRRTILSELAEQLVSNQTEALRISRRAAAPVAQDAAQWDRVHKELLLPAFKRAGLSGATAGAAPSTQSLASFDTAGSPARPSPQPRCAASPATAAAPAPPPPESATISELSWLQLGQATRGNVKLDELNEFWRLLLGLFRQREARTLQAAQLLALGVRMSEANTKKLRLLEKLNLLRVQNNSLTLL